MQTTSSKPRDCDRHIVCQQDRTSILRSIYNSLCPKTCQAQSPVSHICKAGSQRKPVRKPASFWQRRREHTSKINISLRLVYLPISKVQSLPARGTHMRGTSCPSSNAPADTKVFYGLQSNGWKARIKIFYFRKGFMPL